MAAESAKQRQARKRSTTPEPKQAPDVRVVDFNRIVRNLSGRAYRTANSAPLRLGRAVIDALEQVGAREDGRPLEKDEKLRRDKLAGALVTDGLAVEAPEYVTLALPQRVVVMLDGVLGQAYAPGLYGAAHRLLHGTAVNCDDYGYEGIERVAPAGPPEADDGAPADYTPDEEEGADDADAKAAAGPAAGDLAE